MTLVFFHQNPVAGTQGGIERYISTLLDQGGERCALVSASDTKDNNPCHYSIAPSLSSRVPQWLRFVAGVWKSVAGIREFLKIRGATVLELSRPEYIFFSFLFPGRKIFTIHGTGPSPRERGKFLLHHACCFLLPLFADNIQIIGRDASGLPKWVRHSMRNKITFIDAWYDDCFCATPFPNAAGSIKIFYAGRLAKMKNPELLFAIVRRMKARRGDAISFSYFGSSGSEIPTDIRNNGIKDYGLLSANELAHKISECHMGILCSGFGEGSPFIVAETLASGRGYVLPPLPGLKETYGEKPGILFGKDYTPESFERQIEALFAEIRSGILTPEVISQGVATQSKAAATVSIINRLIYG